MRQHFGGHKLWLTPRSVPLSTDGGGEAFGSDVFEGYDYVGSSAADYNTALNPARRFLGGIVADALNTFSTVNGQDRAWPFIIARDGVIDTLSIEQTGAAAVGNVRFAIYENASSTRLYPTNLLFDSGSISTNVAAGIKTVTATLTVTAGTMLWAMFNASVVVAFRGMPASMMRCLGGTTGTILDNYNCFTRNRAFAAFPDPYPSDSTANAARNNAMAIQAFFSS